MQKTLIALANLTLRPRTCGSIYKTLKHLKSPSSGVGRPKIACFLLSIPLREQTDRMISLFIWHL